MPFGVIGDASENGRKSELAKDLWVTSKQVVKAVLEDQKL